MSTATTHDCDHTKDHWVVYFEWIKLYETYLHKCYLKAMSLTHCMLGLLSTVPSAPEAHRSGLAEALPEPPIPWGALLPGLTSPFAFTSFPNLSPVSRTLTEANKHPHSHPLSSVTDRLWFPSPSSTNTLPWFCPANPTAVAVLIVATQ